MSTFIATILNIEPDCNPEYAYVPIKADDEKDAEKQAKAIIKSGELQGLGWSSYRDVDLWGKVQTVLVDVTTEADHFARAGHGNTHGSEGQDDREARFRKATKV